MLKASLFVQSFQNTGRSFRKQVLRCCIQPLNIPRYKKGPFTIFMLWRSLHHSYRGTGRFLCKTHKMCHWYWYLSSTSHLVPRDNINAKQGTKNLERRSYSLPTCFEIPATTIQIIHLLLHSPCWDWISLLNFKPRRKQRGYHTILNTEGRNSSADIMLQSFFIIKFFYVHKMMQYTQEYCYNFLFFWKL